MSVALAAFCILAALAREGVCTSPPPVHIQNGTVVGTYSAGYHQDFFLGIPFAEPPVDSLRFRNPRSFGGFDDVFHATQYAPQCVGYSSSGSSLPQSEDCLYLNIIRPAGHEHKHASEEPLPVGVWIHGGNLVEGGTRDARYNLSYIVENSVKVDRPIIAVSIAYRLSGWGFLASQEVSGSGNTNMGLRDQRLALHWVQENIAAFGGDPRKVTIWGESAGADSVGAQLTAYNGRDDGLFWAAIMESGNPVNYDSYRTESDHQPMYDELVNITGCSNTTDTLECLRHAPFEVLDDYFNTSASGNTVATLLDPIVDGDIIARWSSLQLAEGAFVHVPIIDGTNTDEGTSFSLFGINNMSDFAASVASSTNFEYLPAALVPELLAHYPDNPAYWIPPVEEIGNYTYPEEYGALYRYQTAYWGDVMFTALRRGTCQTWAAEGLPVYSYRFNTLPNGYSAEVGVTHFTEVSFVMANIHGNGYATNPFADKPQSYTDLAFHMSASWASFMHDRDPNGWQLQSNSKATATPAWPRYDNADPKNIVWDANVTALAFVEGDTWRAEGMRWIWEHNVAYKR